MAPYLASSLLHFRNNTLQKSKLSYPSLTHFALPKYCLQFVRRRAKLVDFTNFVRLVRGLGNRYEDCRLTSVTLVTWRHCSLPWLFLIFIEYKINFENFMSFCLILPFRFWFLISINLRFVKSQENPLTFITVKGVVFIGIFLWGGWRGGYSPLGLPCLQSWLGGHQPGVRRFPWWAVWWWSTEGNNFPQTGCHHSR